MDNHIDFYEALAPGYDALFMFEERLKTESALLKPWVDRFTVTSAVDAACGTGLHAFVLARMGIAVTGVDLSPAMVAKANDHAKKLNLSIPFVTGTIQELHKLVKTRVNAIFCTGNTIPHLTKKSSLVAAFRSFKKCLTPKGGVVLQLLNYRKILKDRDRIVGINRRGKTEFIRFYDLGKRNIRFNMLTITEADKGLSHTLESTTLYPYRSGEVACALKAAGFSDIKLFGSLAMEPYMPKSSDTLVVSARV
ncbi:MAG: hypothetical protein A2487_00280 [Candidatus Raymondbacteria bacterium RifOxyC12_full_50_8]|uniref:Methyltransferase domain-containing protein n=1 Tax=Candidatus Raymondbacteria bacterium RIFOXYD12_FULL_49_13 TaxID=1817890 RepID=A0A1F7FLF0_UNCRA|nr:MAG: hypothetical protein A2248_08790 [Candidatus Raymondbacteria bacterium RIFOXYA2_FULL_49_16]OGK07490.1 MAG: hypothetical protein A2519_20235 [Candidatus Raymondbacteria bacterium RIFOXYD12_FULL_49_13]OGK07775.1 MAG: hypothetical protein A2487_00280 [Candidatus Raymondbacteria bacterium RifOxyC12_full_50_8]OGP43846.1 MAG: hypothetical protein A2324_01465 [Candidatus Raymondbacteria bacterium RIFOXYB2_FULL_49_35]